MQLTPLEHLLSQQTEVIQQLALYLQHGYYHPSAKDFLLLEDLTQRGMDLVVVCRSVEGECWRRSERGE